MDINDLDDLRDRIAALEQQNQRLLEAVAEEQYHKMWAAGEAEKCAEALEARERQLREKVERIVLSKCAPQKVYDDLDNDGELGHIRKDLITLTYAEIRELRLITQEQ